MRAPSGTNFFIFMLFLGGWRPRDFLEIDCRHFDSFDLCFKSLFDILTKDLIVHFSVKVFEYHLFKIKA